MSTIYKNQKEFDDKLKETLARFAKETPEEKRIRKAGYLSDRSQESNKINEEKEKIIEPKKVEKTNNGNKGISFVFTDYDKNNIKNGYSDIYSEFSDIIRGIAWGVETCPKTGRAHNQAYIQLYKQSRYSAIQKMIKSKCHFEVMMGSIEHNENYCSKEGKYKKLGNFVSRGYRSDLHNIKDDLKQGASMYDIMENYTGDFVRYHSGISKMKELIDKKNAREWRPCEVTTITGKAGEGKTRYVMEKEGYDNVFILDNDGNDSFMFNGYDGEKVLLIDDFNGWIKYTYMLRILDGYPLRLNIKNGVTWARFDRVYITSNAKPANFYKREIKKNFKRRINSCLEVIKGNTNTLIDPWEKDYFDDEYCE